MKILAIETSCDETAIAILECIGDPSNALGAGEKNAEFTVLGNALLSQIEIHKKYGGVFPALAKREHAKNLVPILVAVLEDSKLLHGNTQTISEEMRTHIYEVLVREPGLAEAFFVFISQCKVPEIDAIAVTAGPGLEPALWVGINFAKALAFVWGKPLVAVNHMEGHILAALASERSDLNAGFQGRTLEFKLPRPMIDSGTCDFSFAGLKTAVLYLLKDIPNVSEQDKKHIAHEFENAVVDVLWKKTSRALAETGARMLVIGGGVSANTHIKRTFKKHIANEFPEVELRIPEASLSTDNAIMIALSGYYHAEKNDFAVPEEVIANGNEHLA